MFHLFVLGDGRWSDELHSPMAHSHLRSDRSEITAQMIMCLKWEASWTSERTWASSGWGFTVTIRFQEKRFTAQLKAIPWGRQWFSISSAIPLPHPRRAIYFQRSQMTTQRFSLNALIGAPFNSLISGGCRTGLCGELPHRKTTLWPCAVTISAKILQNKDLLETNARYMFDKNVEITKSFLVIRGNSATGCSRLFGESSMTTRASIRRIHPMLTLLVVAARFFTDVIDYIFLHYM